MTKTTTKYGIAALVAILAMSTVAIALSQSAIAAPANKTAFGGEGIGSIAESTGFETISWGTIKTSTPSDLLVRHDQECAIHTGLNLDINNEDLTSAIREEVRLKVTDADNVVRYINPVPLGPEGDESDPGDTAVTMCGRAYNIDTNILSTIYELCQFADGIVPDTCPEEDPYFNSYIRTKSSHGWSWIVTNVGSGDVKIEVESRVVSSLEGLDVENTNGNKNGKKVASDSPNNVDTILEIGKRSLIITEEKFASSVG